MINDMWYKKEGQKPIWVQDSNPRPVPIKEELEKAVEDERYERAAVLRDRLKSINKRD